MSNSSDHVLLVVAASTAEKKSAEEPEAKNDKEVPSQTGSATGDDDNKSRDQMTSSDPERGDSGVDNRQQTPSVDDTAEATAADDSGKDVQAATSPDATALSTTDRKKNSDKPEPETASSGVFVQLYN